VQGTGFAVELWNPTTYLPIQSGLVNSGGFTGKVTASCVEISASSTTAEEWFVTEEGLIEESASY